MLDKIQEFLKELIQNKKFLVILVIVIIFIGLAYYVYVNHISPKLNPSFIPNKEIELGSSETNEAELYFFYTTWCPHCKKAKPEWEKLTNEYQDKTINNYKVYFKDVDCDKEEDLANKFNVEGYPTIKLVKNGQVIEYDAKPEYASLVEFLNVSL